jgi:uncharacterized protein
MNARAEEVLVTVKDVTANPAPLGLLGFGLTTILLNLHNTGHYALGAAILATGVFVGGIAQLIAGIMEWKKANTFGTVAFIAYGSFWIATVALILGPTKGLGTATSEGFMGWYFLFWGLFTFFMFIGTFRINRALQVVFGTLVILFWLLAARDFSGNVAVGHVAGWVGIVCGLSALYAAMAQILNELYGKVIMPLGPVKK